jgi:hypothetical protein
MSWLVAWLFWRPFVVTLIADSRFLRSNIMSVCNISFVELFLLIFGAYWGMCGENACNVFMLLFVVLWVPIYLRNALQEGGADVVASLDVHGA